MKNKNTFNGLQYAGLYRHYRVFQFLSVPRIYTDIFQKDLLKNNIKIADNIWERGGIRHKDFRCFKMPINHEGQKVYEKILFINVIGTEITQEIACTTGSNKSKRNPEEGEVVVSLLIVYGFIL